jgi:hypothetical protein
MTDGGNEQHAFSVSALAFNEISVVAPPDTGKTTTLIQASAAILAPSGTNKAAARPCSEWASETDTVLRRQAFDGFQERHLMLLAHHGLLVLLLDGWNELDIEARRRAKADIKGLRRDLPRLGIAPTANSMDC